jgi:hypothetical protein
MMVLVRTAGTTPHLSPKLTNDQRRAQRGAWQAWQKHGSLPSSTKLSEITGDQSVTSEIREPTHLMDW